MDIAQNRTPLGQSISGFQDDRPAWKKITDTVLDFGKGQLQEAFPCSGETKPDAQGRYPINWKGTLTIGTMMGAAQAAMPKSKLPQDTSGINIPAIRAAALRGEGDFLPPASATTAYAQGGRIGYDNGGEAEAPWWKFWGGAEDPEQPTEDTTMV